MAIIEISVPDGDEKKAAAAITKLGYEVVDVESEEQEEEEKEESAEPEDDGMDAEGMKRQFQAMKGLKNAKN